jgi:phospholipid/cholesterol/gamma-HCH transport system substrate-binding protein
MAKQTINNIKLGAFVLAGILALIIGLYLIGRDTNLFSRNYTLYVQFENTQGLTPGNNIRYSGIQVGTVKKVKILNDTLIEVTMIIEEKMKKFIHQADQVSISTDGLMGNRLLNITPGKNGSPLAKDGDMLVPKKTVSTEEMLATLDKTNRNIAIISEELKHTVERINNSKALWGVLENENLPSTLTASLNNIRRATANADQMVKDMQGIITDVKNGKGSLGKIVTDTAIAYNLNSAIEKIKLVGDNADLLAIELNNISLSVKKDINEGKGPANAILKDSVLVLKLNSSLSNIEKGTAAFNENMEALKDNFLLRGYFRKLERQKKEAEKKKQQTKTN